MSQAPPWVRGDTTAAHPVGPDEELVFRFLDALVDPDVDELCGYLAEDAMYQNMPLPPAHGREAVRATLTGLFQALAIRKIDTFFVASRDGYVFTERIDHLTATTTGRSFPLPVCGVFRVHQNKITDWRDYFDLRSFEDAVGMRLA